MDNTAMDTWTAALTGTDSGDFVDAGLWEENATPTIFEVPLGLSPLPDNDDEVNLVIDQAGFTHGAFVGRVGSGKSTALETLLWGLAVKYPPSAVEFVFASGKGPAPGASGMPHAREMFDVADAEEAEQFATYVHDLVSEREAFAKAQGAEVITPADLPAVFIVAEEVAYVQASGFMDALELVATRGRRLGMHLIVVGQVVSSSSFPSAVVQSLGWCVAFSDPGDELLFARPAAGFGDVKPGSGYVLTASEARGVQVFSLGIGEYQFVVPVCRQVGAQFPRRRS